jgi:hypothetical protein
MDNSRAGSTGVLEYKIIRNSIPAIREYSYVIKVGFVMGRSNTGIIITMKVVCQGN